MLLQLLLRSFCRLSTSLLRRKFRTASSLLPADTYEQVNDIKNLGVDPCVLEVHAAKKGSEDVGYCVKVAPRGYGGEISMIVGIDNDVHVTRVNIVSMAETAGLGTKVANDDFLAQFDKKGDDLALSTSVTPKDNEISAIAGATKSSKAVTTGVQAAIGAVINIKGAVQ
ncbi:MAG: FMN-binding protein [Clostridia bacterium]